MNKNIKLTKEEQEYVNNDVVVTAEMIKNIRDNHKKEDPTNLMSRLIQYFAYAVIVCIMIIIMSGVLFLTVQAMRYFFDVMMNGVSFHG